MSYLFDDSDDDLPELPQLDFVGPGHEPTVAVNKSDSDRQHRSQRFLSGQMNDKKQSNFFSLDSGDDEDSSRNDASDYSQGSLVVGSNVKSKKGSVFRQQSYTSLSSNTTEQSSQQSCSSGGTAKRKQFDPEAVARKAAKLEERERKLKEKEEKKLKRDEEKRKRDEIKQELEYLKYKKQMLQVAARSMKPGECLKYLNVMLDVRLVNEPFGGAILEQLQAAGIKYEVSNLAQSNIIFFSRSEMILSENGANRLETTYKGKVEKEVLVYVPLPLFLQLVDTYHKDRVGMSFGAKTLIQFVQETTRVLDDCSLTLLVQGIQTYYRNRKTDANRAFRQQVMELSDPDAAACGGSKKKKATASDLVYVERLQVEEALVELQLETNTCVQFVETNVEMSKLVLQYAKAIAERPYKLEQMKAGGFDAFVEPCRGQKVLTDGTGVTDVWCQQLQQFKNMSVEIASAIVAVYPSPRALINAYKACTSAREAENLLEDIVVRRGGGVLATSRRVGPEMSRRIHAFMTGTDPLQTVL